MKQIWHDLYRKAHKRQSREHGPLFAMQRGLEIAFSPYVGKHHMQFRFPRTKRKRTRKKWAKRPENWRTTYDSYVIGGKTLLMHTDQQLAMEELAYCEPAPTLEKWAK